MGAPIPLEVNPTRHIEIDASLVAPGLGLDIAEFKRLMEQRKITVLCERGTGEDAGLYRASFYHDRKRVRLVVNGQGNPAPEIAGEGSPGGKQPPPSCSRRSRYCRR